ncbi:hypothetical protein BC830DRAFT_1169955 [Chytriomyces sp. MP71]|nr:hypothetical protein BC830DRAFT_1169955 [Chytriomyces sp. MP71]
MVYDVKDKVALITGVGAGFGAELAMRLASKGAKVIGCDINAENGQRTVAILTSRFGTNAAMFYECDVSEMAQIDAVFAKGIAKLGREEFDGIVVNNAGVGEGSKFIDDPEADFKLDLNDA